MMEYFYRIYGLRVQSQIPFSEAVPETAGEAEVKIVFGRMPYSSNIWGSNLSAALHNPACSNIYSSFFFIQIPSFPSHFYILIYHNFLEGAMSINKI